LQDDSEPAPSALLGEFNAYARTYSGGVYVAAGHLGSLARLTTGSGSGGSPEVKVIDSTQLSFLNKDSEPTGPALFADFFAYDPSFGGGVRVGYADVNNDGVPDVISGPGFSGGPEVKVIDGTMLTNLQTNGEISQAAVLNDFYAFAPDLAGGVFVGVVAPV
jgi:hypothetical protein